MRTTLYSILLLSLFACQKNSLPEYGTVKDFTFTNSDGAVFSSSALSGKVWLFNLFFTSCEGPCPLITGNLKEIYSLYKDQPNFKILSLSVDPERDNPQKLTEYAKRFDVNPANWFFVVGPEAQMREVAINSFKLGTQDDAKLHSNRVVLVDSEGKIRGTYLGIVPEDIKKLKSDIKRLL